MHNQFIIKIQDFVTKISQKTSKGEDNHVNSTILVLAFLTTGTW